MKLENRTAGTNKEVDEALAVFILATSQLR